jgi:hypothetical protein
MYEATRSSRISYGKPSLSLEVKQRPSFEAIWDASTTVERAAYFKGLGYGVDDPTYTFAYEPWDALPERLRQILQREFEDSWQ